MAKHAHNAGDIVSNRAPIDYLFYQFRSSIKDLGFSVADLGAGENGEERRNEIPLHPLLRWRCLNVTQSFKQFLQSVASQLVTLAITLGSDLLDPIQRSSEIRVSEICDVIIYFN